MSQGPSNSEAYREMLNFVADWARRTDDKVKSEYRRLGIGFSKELYPSIKSKVLQLAGEKIGIETSFLGYGRLVDMGAGPGSPTSQATLQSIIQRVENPETNRLLIMAGKRRKRKVRRPKKFYSRIVYGRFNALLGIVSGAMVEEAVRIVREEVGDKATVITS